MHLTIYLSQRHLSHMLLGTNARHVGTLRLQLHLAAQPAAHIVMRTSSSKPLFCGRHGGDAFSPRSSGRLAASGPRLPTQVIDHGIVCTIHAVFCPQKTARASEFSIMLTNIFFPDTDRQEAQQYFSQHHAATKGALSARTRAQCHCCTGAAFFHARHARFAHNIVHTLGLF